VTTPEQIKGAILAGIEDYADLRAAPAAAERDTAVAERDVALAERDQTRTDLARVTAELEDCRRAADPDAGGTMPISSLDVLGCSMINVKSYGSSVYTHTAAVAAKVVEWGGAIVREEARLGAMQTRQRKLLDLLRPHGVKVHFTMGNITGPYATMGEAQFRTAIEAELREQVAAVRPYADMLHSLGGPNEVDSSKTGTAWAQHAAIAQKVLWRAVRAETAFDAVPIYGPSSGGDWFDTPDKADKLLAALVTEAGSVEACMDGPNPHLYQRGGPPTQNLDAMNGVWDRIDARRPSCFTETGYSNNNYNRAGQWVQTDAAGMPVPEAVAGIYGPRGLVEFARRGLIWGRFELLDDPGPLLRESRLGLVGMTRATVATSTPDTWYDKPELDSMGALHSALRGDGTEPDLTPLDVTVDAPEGVESWFLQSDRAHRVLLWRDVAVFEPRRDRAGSWITVEPATATLTVPAGYSGGGIHPVAGELVVVEIKETQP